MEVQKNMELLQKLFLCGNPVYTWKYDIFGDLLSSNCPDEYILTKAFDLFGCKDAMLEHAIDNDTPIMLSTPIGLSWNAAFDKKTNGTLTTIYVIGPVFQIDSTIDAINSVLGKIEKFSVSIEWKNHFLNVLKKIPIVSHSFFNQYALMMYCAITGENKNVNIISYQKVNNLLPESTVVSLKDRHKIWQTEQMLLQMIREGDLNYEFALSQSSGISNGVPISTKDPIGQGRASAITFVALSTRAAIEGGLLPDEAYSVGDAYLQSIENATSISELSAITHGMYRDFILRVNKCRTNLNVSKIIRSCVNYIELHVEEKIDIRDLSKRFGYTDYYLSRIFKEQMSMSVNDYIKMSKIERAKLLLISTDETIAQISERLGFCSRSYFGQIFKNITGVSAVTYRDVKK